MDDYRLILFFSCLSIGLGLSKVLGVRLSIFLSGVVVASRTEVRDCFFEGFADTFMFEGRCLAVFFIRDF